MSGSPPQMVTMMDRLLKKEGISIQLTIQHDERHLHCVCALAFFDLF
jgi:hypothetical protein